MFHNYIQGGALVLVAWVIFVQARHWYRWRVFKQWAKQNGCEDVHTVVNRLPWGIERFAFLFNGKLAKMDFLEDVVRARARREGRWTYRLHNPANTSHIATSEPENIQALLATKFSDFSLGPLRNNLFREIIGNGIFTADGESWTHYRRQLKPQFSREQVSDLEATSRHVDIFFRALPTESAQGWIEVPDLMPYIYRFTMDVSTEFLFGHSVTTQSRLLDSQDSGNLQAVQEDLEFAEAMSFASEYTGHRAKFGAFYWLIRSNKFVNACKTVQTWADRYVVLALDENKRRTSPQDKKFILLDELVSETRDPIELRDQVLHVFAAGRDTTAALIGWVFLLLAKHPQEFNKLRGIVISHFGTDLAPTNEITFSSMKACTALNNVLYETLRLYPIVPLNGRSALRNTILPVGGGPDGRQPIAVMAGEQVGFHPYVTHRRQDIWGEDADEFHPDRWIHRKLGWEISAFGGGPRMCLGQLFALNEVSFVLVRFLQRFDGIYLVDKAAPLKKRLSVTLSPSPGQKLLFHRASS